MDVHTFTIMFVAWLINSGLSAFDIKKNERDISNKLCNVENCPVLAQAYLTLKNPDMLIYL